MDRRSFLRFLGGAGALTTAGLLVPEAPQRVYSFLTNNPLALRPAKFIVFERLPLPVMPLAEGLIPSHRSELVTASRVTAQVDQWGAWYAPDGTLAERSPWWKRHGYPFQPTEIAASAAG